MVSYSLLVQIHQRLSETFGEKSKVPFSARTITLCGDLLQLPPVMGKRFYSENGFFTRNIEIMETV